MNPIHLSSLFAGLLSTCPSSTRWARSPWRSAPSPTSLTPTRTESRTTWPFTCRPASKIVSFFFFFLSLFTVFRNSVLLICTFAFTSSTLSMVGLFLIALGTGGIKPCVAAFGGDQFDENQVRSLPRCLTSSLLHLHKKKNTLLTELSTVVAHCGFAVCKLCKNQRVLNWKDYFIQYVHVVNLTCIRVTAHWIWKPLFHTWNVTSSCSVWINQK